MVGNAGRGSQTPAPQCSNVPFPYTERGPQKYQAFKRNVMVESRIKPFRQQAAEQERRTEQRRIFRRNQVFGLLLIAAAILIWRMFHTNPAWIFPPGWWRP
jgi:hypothetical protein